MEMKIQLVTANMDPEIMAKVWNRKRKWIIIILRKYDNPILKKFLNNSPVPIDSCLIIPSSMGLFLVCFTLTMHGENSLCLQYHMYSVWSTIIITSTLRMGLTI